MLDTFNDQRRAYELFSTPLGVQIDAINDDVSQNYDDSWNAIWDSAARITANGYEVEMAIPFNQVRFQRVEGDQVWGFDAIRSYPREYRHHIGAFPRERGNNSYLSQAIKLRGMASASPGSNLEIIPTITGARTDTREDFPDGSMDNGEPDTDVGVSLRWGVTPFMSLNGAVNPDFSQVEADALQLDVNEQFALFFRETRPFFMEGADYFNTDMQLVHTRNISDPSSAGKLTGKKGRHTWGIFTAADDETNVLLPGVEASDAGSFASDNVASAARYRMDFGRSSTIGNTLTDRRGHGYANSVYSADTVYRFSDKDRITTSVALSRTEYSDEMQRELGLNAGANWDEAALAIYQHTERGWWVEGIYSQFDEDFRSDLGFRPSVGLRDLRLGGAKVWWGEQDSFFKRWAWGAAAERSDRQRGGMLESRFETWANARGPKESLISGNAFFGTRNFDGVEFDLWEASSNVFVQATGDFAFSVDVSFGDWIDFTHVRPAKRYFARPSLRYTFGRHLYIHFAHIFSALDVDGGRLFTIHAPELRLIHQFNTRAYVRLVLQYTDIDRDTTLYTDAIDAEERSLLTQVLLTYKVNPQTALYLGYGGNRFGNESFDMAQADRTFFAKLGYAWLR